jgi:hypothetical protein
MGEICMSSLENRILTKPHEKRAKGKIVTGIILIVLLTVSAILTGCLGDDNESNENKEFEDTEDEPDIVEIPDDEDDGDNGTDDNGTSEEPEPIPAMQIPTGEITTDAKWYPYDSDGVEIRFFAVKSNDQEIHVAFDACDVCYQEKKGYRQENIQMTCNNCDNSYPIKLLGTENDQGGCWPSYLPISIEENYVIIKISDLEEKRYMFE